MASTAVLVSFVVDMARITTDILSSRRGQPVGSDKAYIAIWAFVLGGSLVYSGIEGRRQTKLKRRRDVHVMALYELQDHILDNPSP